MDLSLDLSKISSFKSLLIQNYSELCTSMPLFSLVFNNILCFDVNGAAGPQHVIEVSYIELSECGASTEFELPRAVSQVLIQANK